MKVDIHSVGQQNDHPGLTSKGSQPVGRSAAQVPARMPAPSTKAIYTNGTASKAAPSRGKPGVPKASQKKDPAEFQRERQLAEEEEVTQAPFCRSYRDCCVPKLHAAWAHLPHLAEFCVVSDSRLAFRSAWKCLPYAIGWLVACMPWLAPRWAVTPSPWSICRTFLISYCLCWGHHW